MDRTKLIEIITENTTDTSEVVEYIGVSKQRLSELNKTGKLVAVKKGIYLKVDVEPRKDVQGDLREKYYKR